MKTDSILYKTDGTQETVMPKNKKHFTLEELQAYVNGFIEMIFLNNGRIMIVNEEDKLDRLPLNVRATEIIRNHGAQYFVVGNALVCLSKFIK
jgi:hypothetical protein